MRVSTKALEVADRGLIAPHPGGDISLSEPFVFTECDERLDEPRVGLGQLNAETLVPVVGVEAEQLQQLAEWVGGHQMRLAAYPSGLPTGSPLEHVPR